MSSAERLPPCVTIVLAGPPGRAGRGVAAGTLDDAASGLAALLEATALDGGTLEVFCDLPATEPAPITPMPATAGEAAPARLRRHPPSADLAEAIRMLRALGQLPTGSDVAWVCAGTRVPPMWNARLQASLRRAGWTGCISPLCPGDPWYTPIGDAGHGAALPPANPADSAALDDWLRTNCSADPVQMPAPLAWCGVLRAEVAEALLALRERGQQRLSAPGPEVRRGGDWTLALARDTRLPAACLVVAVAPPPTAIPTDAAQASSLLAHEALADSHPLVALRRTLAEPRFSGPRGAPNAAARPSRRPARLHVAHSWGGGLGAWVREFCAADATHEGYVLRSIGRIGAYGQRLALYHHAVPETPVRTWQLDLPIHATAIAHAQYCAVLDEVIDDFGADSVVVSSLIGHSLDALRSRLPTIGVAHDHYPFCVAIFAHYDGECRSCDAARLRDCIEHNPGHRFFRGVDAGDWLALRKAFVDAVLDHEVTLVAPSPSTALRWRALMPALHRARVEVIPHGVSLPPAVGFEPPAGGRLRLVQIGRITVEKGGKLLETVLPALAQFAELTLIGCGDEAAAEMGGRPGVTTIAAFEPAQLPALIAQACPHLGLQLSVVPETFSFTLSELWHCGVPVLGCRIGSLADRIREGDNGFLCEPTADALLARLRGIDEQREILRAMRARLLRETQRDGAAMVADYRALLPAPGRHATPRRWPRGDEDAAAQVSAGGTGRVRVGALSVDPAARYVDVARAFLDYTIEKTAASPRLPAPLRRLAARAGRRTARGARPR